MIVVYLAPLQDHTQKNDVILSNLFETGSVTGWVIVFPKVYK